MMAVTRGVLRPGYTLSLTVSDTGEQQNDNLPRCSQDLAYILTTLLFLKGSNG
jgi:hypothetical protein